MNIINRKTREGNATKILATQAVIYDWYDNKMGSYVTILDSRNVSIDENLEF